MTEQKDNKLLHHIAAGAGFVGLFLWYYIGQELGFLHWVIEQVPVKYAGAGHMVGIMILMTPGFFIWSRYNRWVEKRLEIKGTYIEDEYYKDNEKLKAEADARKAAKKQSSQPSE